MPKYWGKENFSLGSSPKVGLNAKNVEEKIKKSESQ